MRGAAAGRHGRTVIILCPMKISAAAFFLATLIEAASGCSKVSAAADAEKTVPLAAGPARPSLDNANYRAELRSAGACRKNSPCAAEVLVEAKGDYHINDKYPYRFKLEDPPPPGIKYPKPVVGKEDGTMDERKVVLKVPFVSEVSGQTKVSGTLSLSVCSAANCLMDKQPLELNVKVE
jgi:hypothetical protein